jgi:hypothetical protein
MRHTLRISTEKVENNLEYVFNSSGQNRFSTSKYLLKVHIRKNALFIVPAIFYNIPATAENWGNGRYQANSCGDESYLLWELFCSVRSTAFLDFVHRLEL